MATPGVFRTGPQRKVAYTRLRMKAGPSVRALVRTEGKVILHIHMINRPIRKKPKRGYR